MKKHVRCKVCGFIGEEKEMKTVCPACGVPATAFESYSYNISDKRLTMLNFHLHPIIVHFPQSIAFLSLIFISIAFATKGTVRDHLIIIEKLLSILLPVSVFAAAAAGVFDAKARFKKKFGPRLKQKIIIGAVFLVLSVTDAVLINLELFSFGGRISVIALSFVCFACSGLLGKLGGTLLDAKLSG
ncbi:MAG: rubredoxin-type Fe(Cys)4 protein [Eubacteriales bacterium]